MKMMVNWIANRDRGGPGTTTTGCESDSGIATVNKYKNKNKNKHSKSNTHPADNTLCSTTLSRVTHNNQSLSIVAVNIQYLTSQHKLLEVEQYLYTHNPSVLAITETWNSNPTISHTKFGYTQYNLSPDSTKYPKGATFPSMQSVLVHSTVPHERLDSYGYVDIHMSLQWFRLRTDRTTGAGYTLLCSVYRSPNSPPDTWMRMSDNIRMVGMKYAHMGILLVGDVNARLRECGDMGGALHSHAIYSSVLNPLSLTLLNSVLAYGQRTHTYTSPATMRKGGSITDLAIVNSTLLPQCESLTVLPQSTFTSDHSAIRVTLSVAQPLTVTTATAPHLRYNLAKLDTALFAEHMEAYVSLVRQSFYMHLEECKRGVLQRGCSGAMAQVAMDTALSLVQDCYSYSAQSSCPKTMVRPGQKPWWNLIVNRQQLQSEYYQAVRLRQASPPGTRSEATMSRYREARSNWFGAIKVAKEQMFTDFVAQLDSKPARSVKGKPSGTKGPVGNTPANGSTDPAVPALVQSGDPEIGGVDCEPVSMTSLKRRLFWSHYKRTKPSDFRAAMVMDSTGELPLDTRTSLNNIAQSFAAVSQSKPDSLVHHTRITDSMDEMEYCACTTVPTPLPFSRAALELIFDKIPMSAAGPDDIQVEFMHCTPECMRTMIYDLYSTIWCTGILPSGFTRAKVVPLYKGDGSKAQAGNYRPISITSLLIRALERLLRPMYNGFILPKISRYQSGFRPGYSTLDNIHRAVDHTYNTLRARTYSAMLSIDLSKAFDTVWVDGLLSVLWNKYGIRGSAWLFIKAFLNNRTMYVVGGNERSALQVLTSGVPQGSVLAPVLFLAYVDSLTVELQPFGTAALYADDALAWPDHCDGMRALQCTMLMADRAFHWATRWKLGINMRKSAVLQIYGGKKHKKNDWPVLSWPDGTVIPYVQSMCVLGVTLQGNGRWNSQAATLTGRVSSLAHVISRMCVRTGPPQPISIYTVTRAVILSTIMYGFCLWRPTRTAMHKLQALLSLPLKVALIGTHHSVSTLGVLAEFGIPPLHTLRHAQLLLFVHRQIEAPGYVASVSTQCMVEQRREYLFPRECRRTRLKPTTAAYVRSVYSEAERIAASVLPLHITSPSHWTKEVVIRAAQVEAVQWLGGSAPGRKALALCSPFSSGLFVAQRYLLHETKPLSLVRARFRLDVAHTPTVLHRYDSSRPPSCPHCQYEWADRRHLILHCPHYHELRTRVQSVLYRAGILQLNMWQVLGTSLLSTVSRGASLHRTTHTILSSTGELLKAIHDDLSQSTLT